MDIWSYSRSSGIIHIPPPPPANRVDGGGFCFVSEIFHFHDGMLGCRSDWPCVLLVNKVDLGFFVLFQKFSIFTPIIYHITPPPPGHDGALL